MWYTNMHFAEEGGGYEVFPTRAHFTGSGNWTEVADFTQDQHVRAVVVHELGHFLVNWKLGAYMLGFRMLSGGPGLFPKAVVTSRARDDWTRQWLVSGAAGERACERWLHEEELWTPARAVYAEIMGMDDREAALARDPSLTFDGGPNDYRHLQDEADLILDEVWPVLRRGLPRFTTFGELTGDNACARLGIKNNSAI